MSFKCLKISLLPAVLLLVTPSLQAALNVFACEPEWAALTRALGGVHVKVYSATSSQQDPHHIQARPSLIAKARRADLLVCTGAELEIGWLPLLLRKSGNGNIQPGKPGHFMATDQVELLGKHAILDRSLGDVHAAGNPHIQLDPDRMLQVAERLTQVLIKLDGARQSVYQNNLEQFTQEWLAAINRWREKATSLEGKTLIVHHDSWIYLQQWLGLKRLATLEPKSGIPPSSSHLSTLLSDLKQTPADMIIYAGYQDSKPATWLSQKTGIPALALAASVAPDETLIQWFDQLLAQLVAAGS